MTELQILSHNSVEFERLVKYATQQVRGHLGDVREWHGIDPDDVHYYNEVTGRGACDDDILDNVRDDVVGDLLDDPRNEHIAAESLSDAASYAVYEYILNEKKCA